MSERFLELRVRYADVDLIELGVRVRHEEWSAATTAYASLSFLSDAAASIRRWVQAPAEPLRIEAGADKDIGWLLMEFYLIDRAGHARCAITLATGLQSQVARPAESWRFAIELPTELGLIERFANECNELGREFKGEARLTGMAI